MALVAVAFTPCKADEAGSAPRFETYAGADYDGRAASLYTSTVWSLFSPVNQEGFRLKLDGLANVYGNTNASVFSSPFTAAALKGIGDALAGYQFNCGPVWIKLYGGAAYQAQAQLFYDVGEIVQQRAWGGAAAVQTYWKVNDRVWSAFSASWLQPDNATSLYSRLAYEIYRSSGGLKISAGGEGSLSVNNANLFKEGRALDLYDNYVRGGALINLRYGANDLSLSGGISGGMSHAYGDEAIHPYATISYGRQF
jgi:hypothetical protein